MQSLTHLKKELKDLLTEGIDLAIEKLENLLASSSSAFNDLLLLKSRYKDSNKKLLIGLLSDQEAQLEFNKIRSALLHLIDSLTDADLHHSTQEQTIPPIYNGNVLYRIPSKMQKGVQVACIVRLAFSKEELYLDLEEHAADVVKSIRISDVMGVELIDPSDDKAFQIKSFSEQVQFVEGGLPTEWIFYVLPLKTGIYPLILKISVIEIINGIERKRNVVLEEKVQIVTEPLPEMEQDGTQTTSLSTLAGSREISDVEAKVDLRLVVHGASNANTSYPREFPVPTQPAMPSSKRRSIGNWLAVGMPIVLLCVVAVWAVNLPGMKKQSNTNTETTTSVNVLFEKARKTGDLKALREIIKAEPESDLAAKSRSVIDSLDQALWQEALAKNDPDEYLNLFPDGKYVAAANKLKHSAERDAQNEQPTRQTDIDNEQQSLPAAGPSSSTGANENINPIPKEFAARKPVFPGCKNINRQNEEACTEKRIRQFLSDHLQYPKDALRNRVEGVVNISFIVEKNGQIGNVKALNSLGYGCDEEAIRLIEQLPQFEPGLDAEGHPMRVKYLLPVRFVLN